jgi:hypothetical protein
LTKILDRSFTSDGYKQIRLLAFGDELCQKLAKRMGHPGIVVALTDLKFLDYSEHSGQSMRIESEEQVFTLGKSEDLTFCKGLADPNNKTSII